MATSVTQNSYTNNQHDPSLRHHIVWLDAKINDKSNIGRVRPIRELDPLLKTCTDEKECVEYIQQHEVSKNQSYVISIVSGSLSERVIPQIQKYSCVATILIFCACIEKYQDVKYEKLRKICDNTDELVEQIESYLTRCSDRDIHFSLLNKPESTHSESQTAESQYPIRNLKEDQARFLWFYHFYRVMIGLADNDNARAKEEMIANARQDCDEQRFLSSINTFNDEPMTENAANAILWYTTNSFVYKCVNTALRKESLSKIYAYRYIIKLLCDQLKALHEKFQSHYKQKEGFRLYRGQRLCMEDIALLEDHCGDLISLNGFISTTEEKDIARKFSVRNPSHGLKSVLFEIDIGTAMEQSIVFADIRQVSKFPEEEEILFSIGTIFRIKSVKYHQKNDLWVIRLQLVQRKELDAIKYIEQTYTSDGSASDQSVLFGKLLFDMGEYEFALKYFTDALQRTTPLNGHLQATYLNNIGVCYSEKGDRKNALKSYEAALDIYKRINKKHGLGTCHHNIASVHRADRNYTDAQLQALHALKYRQERTLERASTLDLLGSVYSDENNNEAAEENFQKALRIRMAYLKLVNPNHPDIAVSYQNLGGLCRKTSRIDAARRYYLQAAGIYRHNYPESHALVRNINRCLRAIEK